MVNTDLEGVIKLITDSPYPYFIVRSNRNDVNSVIFRSDENQDKPANIEAFRRTMANVDGEYFVVAIKQNAKDNSGNYTYTFHNRRPTAIGTTQPMPTPATPHITEDELQRRIDLTRREIMCEFQERELQRREKELATQQRDFNTEKTSTIGILVDRIGKVLPRLFPQVAVAGTPTETLPLDQTTPTDPDTLTTQLENILERLAAVEPDYLTLLETITTMAENKDPMYATARQFLIRQ